MRIIADISLNFQGLNDILEIIATVNADIFKLQWYSESDLYGSGDTSTKLNIDWMPAIVEAAKKRGKHIMCTVFSPDRVYPMDKYVYMHKVASSEITDKNLLTQISMCRKPTLVSTGGASYPQIYEAIKILGGICTGLMTCDVEYPSKRHNIRHMLELKNMFPALNVGYSDHSIDICTMPILVVHYCATYYEKHVKPNNPHESYEYHALTVDEFNEMVEVMAGRKEAQKPNPHQRVYDSSILKWVRPRV
jgi:sialic acid synthase SpsE